MVIEENADGADVFWPGYVDAVTNLVLNLLFMLTIMIVAVFMFALELSRHKDDNPVPVVKTPEADIKLAADQEVISKQALSDKNQKIVTLEHELENLRKQVQENKSQDKTALVKNSQAANQKVVVVKTPQPTLDKNLQQAAGGVVVHFINDAVTLSETEADSVRKALTGIVSKGAARIVVEAPAGFSEAKRLAYYRAMAVRNQLIELKLPADKIEVFVREGTASADNAKVLVMEQ